MRKEAKLLLNKGINSLTLSVDSFNSTRDLGRTDVVLILLDHSFEMLLKASLLHLGGKIRKPNAKQTIGFDECVRKALTGGKCAFLMKEQALLLQCVNSLRDASQHHLVDLSEQHLYMQCQAGVTLFRDILHKVFGLNLAVHLPERVLPLSVTPPTDFITLFDSEVRHIQSLLQPGKRRRVEALAKLRALAIVEGALTGEKLQPSDEDLDGKITELREGKTWAEIFPGVASVNISAIGYGPSINLRITKRDGIAVHLVPEDTPGAATVAVKRVDELGFYNLGRDQVAANIGLTGPKTTALIWYLKLQSDPDCFKEIVVGKTKFQRYSQKAVTMLREALGTESIEEVWYRYRQPGKESA